ncbi:hypothetical protein VQL36_01835 [Chengkuizengella sp. SCS-71B]|uniref:hypothetical protein n=1 Tax=Chengkuizengella sp. SCS-71B TaxID=3115290 RepID=UPI0032C21EBD
MEKLTWEELEEIRLDKLNKLLNHFTKKEFYKNYCSENSVIHRPLNHIDELKRYPIVTKKFIRNNIDIIKKNNKTAVLRSTSGSSGENFKFYISRKAKSKHAASKHYFNHINGIQQHKGKTIGIWGGNLQKPEISQTIIRMKHLLLDTTVLPGYAMDDAKAIEYINIINSQKPRELYGYPSYLYKIADVGIKNNMSCYTPPIIVSSGEQLQPYQRETIEEFFNCKILNKYGSCEFSVIAHETFKDQELLINSTQFIVETNDKNELLVTDLDNYATPFIRYNIGDMGEISRLGNRYFLKEIYGRANDVIETPTGKMIPSQFWTILSRTVDGIINYQIVQDDESNLTMNMIVSSQFDNNKSISKLKRGFRDNFGDEMNLIFKFVDHIELTNFGKRKFVIKKVKS